MISHHWQSEFGGQEAAVGARIVIRKIDQVVGVTPPEFFGLEVGRGFDVALRVRGRRGAGFSIRKLVEAEGDGTPQARLDPLAGGEYVRR